MPGTSSEIPDERIRELSKEIDRKKGNGADMTVSEPGAQPAPAGQPQQFTHAAVPIDVIQSIGRLLSRIAMDGQEAGELVVKLQAAQPCTVAPAPPAEE